MPPTVGAPTPGAESHQPTDNGSSTLSDPTDNNNTHRSLILKANPATMHRVPPPPTSNVAPTGMVKFGSIDDNIWNNLKYSDVSFIYRPAAIYHKSTLRREVIFAKCLK